MFDEDAIHQLQQGAAIEQANNAMPVSAIVALPESFKTHDLERLLPERRRARGLYESPFIASFAEYTLAHADAGATVFVDPRNLSASAVLNLGTPQAPGHADNIASLSPTKTSAYLALTQIANGSGRKQSDVAEFLEDWVGSIECFNDEGTIPPPKAIAAVRKITVEALRKVESTEQQLSAQRGVLESVAASSSEPLPTLIYFKCQPYAELNEREFVLRLGVLTQDKPAITLRVIKAEAHAEEMAEELRNRITESLAKATPAIPVVVGTYQAKE